MPSRTLDKIDIDTRIVPVQKALSLFTRRSNHRPIHGFRLRVVDRRGSQITLHTTDAELRRRRRARRHCDPVL